MDNEIRRPDLYAIIKDAVSDGLQKIQEVKDAGKYIPGLLLVAAIIFVYQPVWQAGFIWDDDVYVTGNKLLTAPDGLRRIWLSRDSPSQYFPLV